MMIARNILSGNNVCGTLQKAVTAADHSYFAAAAEPILKVKRDEIEHVREQRDKARSEAEKFRFALELMVQNLIPIRSPPHDGMMLAHNNNIRALLEKTLGRPIPWDTG